MILIALLLIAGIVVLQNDPSVFTDVLIMGINVVTWLINVILTPFNWLIDAFVPNAHEGFSAFYEYISQAQTYINYILDMIFITPFAIAAMTGFIIFKVGLTIAVWSMKMVFPWIKLLGVFR